MKTRKLTEQQRDVIGALRVAGADWTAKATERAWKAGEAYYLDSRLAISRAIRKAFHDANPQP